MPRGNRTCPECGYPFAGNGFDGIDAHWTSAHESVMPYKEAWPLIKAGRYEPSRLKPVPQVKWTRAQRERHDQLMATIIAKCGGGRNNKTWDYNSATWVRGKGPLY